MERQFLADLTEWIYQRQRVCLWHFPDEEQLQKTSRQMQGDLRLMWSGTVCCCPVNSGKDLWYGWLHEKSRHVFKDIRKEEPRYEKDFMTKDTRRVSSMSTKGATQ